MATRQLITHFETHGCQKPPGAPKARHVTVSAGLMSIVLPGAFKLSIPATLLQRVLDPPHTKTLFQGFLLCLSLKALAR